METKCNKEKNNSIGRRHSWGVEGFGGLI